MNSEQLLDILKDEISVEFFTKQQELISKDRLNFATYDSEQSQLDYIESQINDCKDFLCSLKYPYAEIALGFIRFENGYTKQLSTEDELIFICSNIILNELDEAVELLTQQYEIEPSIKELDKISDSVFQKDEVVKIERVIDIAARIDRQQKLESLLNELQAKSVEQVTSKSRLSLHQIALIHVYEGKQITRANGGSIAKEHGHTSGEALFQRYTLWSSATNRKAKPDPPSKKKLINKIERLESVIPLLSDNAKPRAIDELRILKSIFESEYQ